MYKLCFLTLLFLCISICPESYAGTSAKNWCGIYYQEGENSYIRLASEDLINGSLGCSITSYQERTANSGTISVPFEVNKRRTAQYQWLKFNNHLIEIRGRINNGTIENVHFVRDIDV